jgi:hypothetical protein
MIKLEDLLKEEKYNLAGNCVYGLDDPYFRRKVCYDATEMAGIVDEDENNFLLGNEFIQNVNWPSSMGSPDDNIYEFAYNPYKDIYWAYNIEDDVHFFFVKDSINEEYKDSINVRSIKLEDLLDELVTREKDILGQGLEHNVYPSTDPTKVYKLGETRYVKKWVPIFKNNPELFPIIYKTGFYKGNKDITWVEMERLDTEQFEVDFEVLESIIEDVSNYDGALGAIKSTQNNEKDWDKLYNDIKQQDQEIADFYTKLYNNVIQTRRFKSGWLDTYDFHKGQFGYDKDNKVKMLDF